MSSANAVHFGKALSGRALCGRWRYVDPELRRVGPLLKSIDWHAVTCETCRRVKQRRPWWARIFFETT